MSWSSALMAQEQSATAVAGDRYDESLTIKPLNDGKVLAHLQFRTTWEKDAALAREGESAVWRVRLGT